MNALQWTELMLQQKFENMQRLQFQQMQQMSQMQMQLQHQQDDNDDEDSCPEEQRTLFIANLDETKVDDEMLYELFSQAGPVQKVSFPKKKSFAFITYRHSFTPIYAMHLFQGIKLFGTPVVIKFNGSTNAPPLMNRLLPPHYGLQREHVRTQLRNPFAAEPSQRRNFDNSALRNSRLAAFMDDDDRNYGRNSSRDRGYDNHRRHDRSPTRRRGSDRHDRNDRSRSRF